MKQKSGIPYTDSSNFFVHTTSESKRYLIVNDMNDNERCINIDYITMIQPCGQNVTELTIVANLKLVVNSPYAKVKEAILG